MRLRMTGAALAVVLLVIVPGSLGVWYCQADFVAGHALLILEQRCDTNYQYPVGDVFIGWVDTIQTHESIVKRRLCCISGRSPGRETVKCDPVGASKWQRDLGQDLPSYAKTICSHDSGATLEAVGSGEEGSLTSTVMRHGDYLKLRSSHLRKRHISEPEPWADPEGLVFVKVERVMARKAPAQEPFRNQLAYIGKYGKSADQTLCCVDDETPMGVAAPTVRCLRVPSGNDALSKTEKQIRGFVTGKTPLPPAVSCALPSRYFTEDRPVVEDMDLAGFTYLVSTVGDTGQRASLDDATSVLEKAFSAAGGNKRFAEIVPIVQRVPDGEVIPPLTETPECAGAAYHKLDLPRKENRKSNNPFEGAALGIRPLGENGAVAIVNEEVLPAATVPLVGEDTRPHYILKALCAKAMWMDAPVFELRRDLMKLTSRYNGLDLALTTRLGFTKSYRDALMRGMLYVEKDRKQSTCRQLVADTMILTQRIAEKLGPEKTEVEDVERGLTWTCARNRYGDGVCDCTCGAWDVDCNPPEGKPLTFDNAPSRTSCPHEAMRCGPVGCTTEPFLDIDD